MDRAGGGEDLPRDPVTKLPRQAVGPSVQVLEEASRRRLQLPRQDCNRGDCQHENWSEINNVDNNIIWDNLFDKKLLCICCKLSVITLAMTFHFRSKFHLHYKTHIIIISFH